MMGCYNKAAATSCSIAVLVGAVLCASILVADGTPVPTRENAPYTASVFAQPEYLEAVAKELEKEGSATIPAHAAWWIRYQQKMQNDPMYQRDTSMHGNLDQIGGGNLLRRNLDAIGGGNLVRRNLDPIGGGNLLRSIQIQEPPRAAAMKSQDESGHMTRNSRNDYDGASYGHNKKFNGHRNSDSSNSPNQYTETILYPAQLIDLTNSKRNFDEIDRSGFSGFSGKRNFDEIDRTGFSGFSGKRNFDEIDRSGFSGFNKRNFDEIDRSGFSGFNKRNFDEIDRSGFSGFNKRNFDEIDRSGFSGFNKRNFDEIDRSGFSGFNKRNFDEIDRSGFSGFNKKRNFDEIDRSGFSGFNKKRNFDEIDRSGFSGFNKRNFDEIDRSGVPGFTKRSVSRSKLASRRRR